MISAFAFIGLQEAQQYTSYQQLVIFYEHVPAVNLTLFIAPTQMITIGSGGKSVEHDLYSLWSFAFCLDE